MESIRSGKLKVESEKLDMQKGGPIYEKSFAFALRIVKLSKYLQFDSKEYVLSKQVLRSGTAIGALVREAEHAESKPDFTHKMNVALKEANETVYWLELLHRTGYLDDAMFDSISSDALELIKILASIVKTCRTALRKGK